MTNEGPGPTENDKSTWIDRVYFSRDEQLETSGSNADLPLGFKTHSGVMQVGGIDPIIDFEVEIPQTLSGEGYFIVRTDDTDQVFEAGLERRNWTASAMVTIVPRSAELRATRISAVPSLVYWARVSHSIIPLPMSGHFRLRRRLGAIPFYLSSDTKADPGVDYRGWVISASRRASAGGKLLTDDSARCSNKRRRRLLLVIYADSRNDVFEEAERVDKDASNQIASVEKIRFVIDPANLETTIDSQSVFAKSGGDFSLTYTSRNKGNRPTLVDTWFRRGLPVNG